MLMNRPAGRRGSLPLAGTFTLAALASVALLAGCANRDSIKVGAIPDDYRTNHPIVISEKETKIDIPVGVQDRGMTGMQRTALDGFISRYDRKAAPVVSILVPTGSANEAAASRVSADFFRRLRANGVPEGHILHQPYQASAQEAPPIRVSYFAMKASTGPCGRWPGDLLDTTQNKHYANFGCSYQNNLAAQIADPADLLGPRKQTPIDAENRSAAIDVYRERGISDEFFSNSEVDY
ncbi:CpaD family pilus assembly protein [Aquamicrobium sp. LC103]|uniref:CpaD family pilus assembly protein n=1 Tax=Aquamicrobium sp. LC103 TaxID=1120658 RepID=UPI00063E95C7|nr:CpaD family pilus assembly protein [Aquamicrobium sp. LC103]